MDEIPFVLEPLADLRRTLLTTLALIEANDDPVIRADLASELVGTCSRYEDVKERVVYPALDQLVADRDELSNAEDDLKAVRAALVAFRKRTIHVKPAYTRWEDPKGFDATLGGLLEMIAQHMEHEESTLFPALMELDATQRIELRDAVEHGLKHASTYPNPPKNLLGRGVVAVIEKLERGIPDESTTWHPGRDLLEAALRSGDAPSS